MTKIRNWKAFTTILWFLSGKKTIYDSEYDVRPLYEWYCQVTKRCKK